jgi:hypothetical protein
MVMRSSASCRRSVRSCDILYAVRWCDAEVCNGGFHQFYTNPTGVLGPEAAEGFEAIGMKQVVAVVRDTLRFSGDRSRGGKSDGASALRECPGRSARSGIRSGRRTTRTNELVKDDALAKAADAYAARLVN